MDIKKVLQAQVLLGRTPSGRDIGDKSMPFVHDSLDSIKSSDEEFDFIECLNCKFVSDTRAFLDGCINCGCKDKDTFVGTDRQVRKR